MRIRLFWRDVKANSDGILTKRYEERLEEARKLGIKKALMQGILMGTVWLGKAPFRRFNLRRRVDHVCLFSSHQRRLRARLLVRMDADRGQARSSGS